MLSVAVAVPIVLSLTNAVGLPASVERVTSAGTVSVGGTLSSALMTCVPTWMRVLSKDVVPLRDDQAETAVDDVAVVREAADAARRSG